MSDGFAVLRGLVAEVGVVEFGVVAAGSHKVFVAALLDDLAFLQDDDAVCCADGREAMGDDDSSAVLHDKVERFLNLGFGERVNAGGGFIKYKDAGGLEQDAGKGDKLTLPHGEPTAAFANLAVETVG